MDPALTIIVPVFNEEANILPLVREIGQALKTQPRAFELLLVDDGSTDATWEKIKEAHRIDPRVRGLRHAKNCGQSAAIWTGLQSSRGPVVATLDGDLQNDPADLPKMLERLAEFDFICGARVRRRDRWLRRVSSKIARLARKRVLGVDFADTGCALRVFRRAALQGIIPFNGLHRFLPILVRGGGWKTLEIPIHHRPRVAGVSKYGVWNRLGRGIADLWAMAWYQRRRFPNVALEKFPEENSPAPDDLTAPR